MKLLELHPSLVGDVLKFDCPRCSNEQAHKIVLPLVGNKNARRTWAKYGELENLELRPSVRLNCCHFSVIDGEVRLAKAN